MQKLTLLDIEEAETEGDRPDRIEALQRINLRDLAISFGVLTDKFNLLDAVPLASGASVDIPQPEDAASALAALRATGKVLDLRPAGRTGKAGGA